MRATLSPYGLKVSIVSVTPMEMRLSAATSGRVALAAIKAIKKNITINFCFMNVSLLGVSSLPKLLVESLAVQLLDEPIVVERFGLCFFGFRVSNCRLIQNLLDTLARVIGNLVHVIHRVLVNRIQSFGVRGASISRNRAPAEFLVRKQTVHRLRVGLEKSPHQISIGANKRSSCHKSVVRKVNAGFAHIQYYASARFFSFEIRRARERRRHDGLRFQHRRRGKNITGLNKRHILSRFEPLLAQNISHREIRRGTETGYPDRLPAQILDAFD